MPRSTLVPPPSTSLFAMEYAKAARTAKRAEEACGARVWLAGEVNHALSMRNLLPSVSIAPAMQVLMPLSCDEGYNYIITTYSIEDGVPDQRPPRQPRKQGPRARRQSLDTSISIHLSRKNKQKQMDEEVEDRPYLPAPRCFTASAWASSKPRIAQVSLQVRNYP